MNNTGVYAPKMLQLIQLGKLEKGAISTSSKVNSRHGRWFSQEKKSVLVGDNVGGSLDVDICIHRDGVVVQVKCIPYVASPNLLNITGTVFV